MLFRSATSFSEDPESDVLSDPTCEKASLAASDSRSSKGVVGSDDEGVIGDSDCDEGGDGSTTFFLDFGWPGPGVAR